MKKFARIAYYILITLLGFFLAWEAVIYFRHWDEIMTAKDWWILQWKPVLGMLTSYLGSEVLKRHTCS